MSIKPPTFVADLYRDLRDRRLLLPAAALLVGLVAVPVLLSESPPSPAPPLQTQDVDATAATPAVLAEEVGVRNYRKRLAALKRKNPFEQQYAKSSDGSDGLVEATTGSGAQAGGGSSSDGSGEGPGDASISVSGDTGAGDTGAGSQVTPQPREAKRRRTNRWLTWRVDLTFGPVGEVKRYDDVKTLKVLPSRKQPVVAVFGISHKGDRAAFLFTGDVVASEGDGKCSPSQRQCSFLLLRKGEERRVTIAVDEETEITYRLKVRRFNEKIITGPRP